MAKCDGCGNKKARTLQIRYVDAEVVTGFLWWKKHHVQKVKMETCDRCGGVRGSAVPDVYFERPHYDANIVDGMGNEILIRSKGHKQQLLKERGWVEAGLGKHSRYHA